MRNILARLFVRLALVLASLAWIAFVSTETIGDPSRGEAVARAVLDDPAARAEVAEPIASSVMSTFGLPGDQRPLVEAQVERLLRTESGASAFVDPFAGSWARLLGEDDPRRAEFDLAPLLGQFAAETGAPTDQLSLPERLPIPAVPMPRAELDWMAGVRSSVRTAILPLALAAAALFATAFAMGERVRVLRRAGIWALVAGGSWLVVPPLAVRLTGRWAPGADAVVAAALDEATSGLLVAAIALVAGGAIALAVSFVVVAPQREPERARRSRRGQHHEPEVAQRPLPTGTEKPISRRPHDTAELPVAQRPDVATTPVVNPTVAPPRPEKVNPTVADDTADDDSDSVWEYYS